MEPRHRVTFGKYDAVDSVLDSLDIQYRKTPRPHGYYLLTFEIEESDPRWPQIAELIREKRTLDLFNTIFTQEEILATEWARLIPRHEQGYPQPKAGLMWRDVTYEGACPACGLGYRQAAPFRLAREPQLDRYDLMSLFWTYALFCTAEVLETLAAHEIQGYDVWQPVIHRTNQPARSVSQLVIPHLARPGLAKLDQAHPHTCPRCGIIRYAPHLRGYLHLKRKALRPDLDLQLTHEWFAAWSQGGYREIIISNRLARLILERGWRGVALKPVLLV